MRIVRTMMATCLFLGLATGGAALAGAGSGSGSGSAAAPAMAMPKPAPELMDMAKKMAGTWHCTGKVQMSMDGKTGSWKDTKGDLKFSVDLDNWWIKASMTETGTKTPYKFEAFVTYDAMSKKWTHMSMDNMGGHEVSSSDGLKDGAVTWMGEASAMGMTMKVKSVHTMVSDKDIKIAESMSMDGKTWMDTVQVECKK